MASQTHNARAPNFPDDRPIKRPRLYYVGADGRHDLPSILPTVPMAIDTNWFDTYWLSTRRDTRPSKLGQLTRRPPRIISALFIILGRAAQPFLALMRIVGTPPTFPESQG